jgi:hypothetical protein
LTLKGSSSGAESNKLTTHIQRYMRTWNSDKKDTIIKTKTELKMIKYDAQSKIKKLKWYI